MWVEKHRKVWRIRDLIGGRKITLATGYPTKTAARDAMIQLKADAIRGEALVPRGGQITLNEWLDAWWPSYRTSLKPSSAHSEGRRIANHIRPLLGARTLDELSQPLVIQSWVGQLSAGRPGPRPAGAPPLSPKSVRNCHGLLHKILGAAVQQRLIRHNPCADTALPRVERHEMRFLTEQQVERLLAAIPDHWRPMVLFLVATGARWGEAAALRVRDLDILTGRARITRTMHEMPGTGEIVFTEPKSAMSRRTVTFPAKTVGAELAALVVDKQPDDLVFTSPQGKPARIRNFRRGWVRWTVAAGLDTPQAKGERRVGGLRVHDLRHTHAAMLISAGVPLTAIQRRLGHASIAVTSDLYGHLLPVVDEGILAAVTVFLGASPEAAGMVEAEVREELEAA